jgi:hypothetical protein
MKIAVVTESSTVDKNEDVGEALNCFGHEGINVGMKKLEGEPPLINLTRSLSRPYCSIWIFLTLLSAGEERARAFSTRYLSSLEWHANLFSTRRMRGFLARSMVGTAFRSR